MSKATLKPRASEKTYALSEQANTYVFEIDKDINKHSVARAVAEQFGVSVTGVRVASTPAKPKRSYRKRGKYIKARTSAVRKAYVTLKEGDKLPLFSSVEDDKPKTKETK